MLRAGRYSGWALIEALLSAWHTHKAHLRSSVRSLSGLNHRAPTACLLSTPPQRGLHSIVSRIARLTLYAYGRRAMSGLADLGAAFRRGVGAVGKALNSAMGGPAVVQGPAVLGNGQPVPAPVSEAPEAGPAPVDNFPTCLAVILKSEGGYTVDQGGPTNLGVTQRTLSSWLGRAATVAEVQALTPDTAAPLYRALYWNASHCNELPPGVDLMTFDEAVNEGPGRAIKHLQQSCGVTADGMFGPATKAAAASMSAFALINAMHATNADYYASLADTYPQFQNGWLARNDRTRDIAQSMVTP